MPVRVRPAAPNQYNPNRIASVDDGFGFVVYFDYSFFAIDGELFHYRDKSGLEADAIVHLKDGRWGAIEVKMGAKEIEMATENLKLLRNKVNLNKMNEPSFLMVLTGTEFGYRREDGVYIVPIGCLRD